jgi:hypothetical protein
LNKAEEVRGFESMRLGRAVGTEGRRAFDARDGADENDRSYDIELTGFSLGEIDLMLDEAAEKKAEEPEPEDELPVNGLQGPAVSTAGDLWVLGPHRLLCGDARDLSSYQILLEGQQADL